MKRLIIAPFCLLLSCAGFQNNQYAGDSAQVRDVPRVIRGVEIDGPRQRLVVLPVLDAASGHPDSIKTSLERFIIDQLALTNQVVLIQPSDINVSLKDYASESSYQMPSLTEKAREVGVNQLLETVIEKVTITRRADSVGLVRNLDSQIEAVLRFRLVSAKSGKVIFEDRKIANTTDSQYRFAQGRDTDQNVVFSPFAIVELLQNMTYEVLAGVLASLQSQSWEGRIAMVKGDRLYLNVGRLSGIEMGDLLRVSEVGDQVFDPETGVLLGEVSGRMKGTLEVVGYFGKDGAVAIVHSGSGFTENDKVELY